MRPSSCHRISGCRAAPRPAPEHRTMIVPGDAPGFLPWFKNVEPALPKHHPRLILGCHGHQPPRVGRPCHRADAAQSFRPALGGLSALNVHHVGFGQGVGVAVVAPPGDEGNLASVGRPHRAIVVPVAPRDLRPISRFQINREQVVVGVATASPADRGGSVCD